MISVDQKMQKIKGFSIEFVYNLAIGTTLGISLHFRGKFFRGRWFSAARNQNQIFSLK